MNHLYISINRFSILKSTKYFSGYGIGFDAGS